jgi:hypothetical protein
MELNTKNFTMYTTKKYLKINSFFFFFNGVNRKSSDWVIVAEQNLKNLNFSYYKNFNKIIKKTLKYSTYQKLTPVIKSPTFFLEYNNQSTLKKQLIIENFESLLFILLAIKLNNKCYPVNLLKLISSLNMKENDKLIYQFYLTNFKCYTKISK